MIRIYIGNLPSSISEKEVQQVFETFGPVQSVDLVKDKRTGKSWGYGFVSMVHNNEARRAIETVNNQEYWGRIVRVEQSRRRPVVHFGNISMPVVKLYGLQTFQCTTRGTPMAPSLHGVLRVQSIYWDSMPPMDHGTSTMK